MNDLQKPEPVKPEPRSLFVRYPFELYETEKSANFRLNQVEREIVRVYVETLSAKRCLEALVILTGKADLSLSSVYRKLKRVHVQSCIDEGLKARALAEGLTEDKWKALGARAMVDGVFRSKMDHAYWKEMGKACGYYKEPVQQGAQVVNQISFVQANGEA